MFQLREPYVPPFLRVPVPVHAVTRVGVVITDAFSPATLAAMSTPVTSSTAPVTPKASAAPVIQKASGSSMMVLKAGAAIAVAFGVYLLIR